MCIVCDIQALGASPEIVAKAETMLKAFRMVLSVHQEVRNADKSVYTEKHRLTLVAAIDAMEGDNKKPTGMQAIIALIKALGGTVEIEEFEVGKDGVLREAGKGEDKPNGPLH